MNGGFRLVVAGEHDYRIEFDDNDAYRLSGVLKDFFNGVDAYSGVFKFLKLPAAQAVQQPDKMVFQGKPTWSKKLFNQPKPTVAATVRFKTDPLRDLREPLCEVDDNDDELSPRISQLVRTTVSLVRQPTGLESGQLPKEFAVREMGSFLQKLLANQASLVELYGLYLFFVENSSQLQLPCKRFLQYVLKGVLDESEQEIVFLINQLFGDASVAFQFDAIKKKNEIMNEKQKCTSDNVKVAWQAISEVLKEHQKSAAFAAINGEVLLEITQRGLTEENLLQEQPSIAFAWPIGLLQGLNLYRGQFPLPKGLLNRLDVIVAALCFEAKLTDTVAPSDIVARMLKAATQTERLKSVGELAMRFSDIPRLTLALALPDEYEEPLGFLAFQASEEVEFFNSVTTYALQAVRYYQKNAMIPQHTKLAACLESIFSKLNQTGIDAAPILVAALNHFKGKKPTLLSKALFWVFAFRINSISREQLNNVLTKQAPGFDKWFMATLYDLEMPESWLRNACPRVPNTWVQQLMKHLPDIEQDHLAPSIKSAQTSCHLKTLSVMMNEWFDGAVGGKSALAFSQLTSSKCIWRTLTAGVNGLNCFTEAALKEAAMQYASETGDGEQVSILARWATPQWLVAQDVSNPLNRSAFWQVVFKQMDLPAQIAAHLKGEPASALTTPQIKEEHGEKLHGAYCRYSTQTQEKVVAFWQANKDDFLENRAGFLSGSKSLSQWLITASGLQSVYDEFREAIKSPAALKKIKQPFLVKQLLRRCCNGEVPPAEQEALLMELVLLLKGKLPVLQELNQALSATDPAAIETALLQHVQNRFRLDYANYKAYVDGAMVKIYDYYNNIFQRLLTDQIRKIHDELQQDFAEPATCVLPIHECDLDQIIDEDSLTLNTMSPMFKKLVRENHCHFLTEKYLSDLVYIRDCLCTAFQKKMRERPIDFKSVTDQARLRLALYEQFVHEAANSKALSETVQTAAERQCLFTLGINALLDNPERHQSPAFRLDLLKQMNRLSFQLIVFSGLAGGSVSLAEEGDRSEVESAKGDLAYRTVFAEKFVREMLPLTCSHYCERTGSVLDEAAKTKLWQKPPVEATVSMDDLLACLTTAFQHVRLQKPQRPIAKPTSVYTLPVPGVVNYS